MRHPNDHSGFAFSHPPYDGLTRREYYAAHAPITVDDAEKFLGIASGPHTPEIINTLAELRWRYADAMLEQEDK